MQPVCDCAVSLTWWVVTFVSRTHQETERERAEYQRFLVDLAAVESSSSLSSESVALIMAPATAPPAASDDDVSLQVQEDALLAQLDALRSERMLLHGECRRLQSEAVCVDDAEQRLFNEYHSFGLELQQLSSEHAALVRGVQSAAERLERLKRVNVFDDAFHISTDGHFGTINGLRCGTLPGSQPVDWHEINAALGHACMLLATLTRRCSFKLTKYGVNCPTC